MRIVKIPARLLSEAGWPGLGKWLRPKLLALVSPRWSRVKWHSNDGRVLRICDMDSAHLLNALRYRMRHPGGASRAAKLTILKREAARRGLPNDGTLPAWLKKENAAFWKSKEAARLRKLRESRDRFDAQFDRMFFHDHQF